MCQAKHQSSPAVFSGTLLASGSSKTQQERMSMKVAGRQKINEELGISSAFSWQLVPVTSLSSSWPSCHHGSSEQEVCGHCQQSAAGKVLSTLHRDL